MQNCTIAAKFFILYSKSATCYHTLKYSVAVDAMLAYVHTHLFVYPKGVNKII
jgi:hypothetical protein